jgi:hypothetical protein
MKHDYKTDLILLIIFCLSIGGSIYVPYSGNIGQALIKR